MRRKSCWPMAQRSRARRLSRARTTRRAQRQRLRSSTSWGSAKAVTRTTVVNAGGSDHDQERDTRRRSAAETISQTQFTLTAFPDRSASIAAATIMEWLLLIWSLTMEAYAEMVRQVSRAAAAQSTRRRGRCWPRARLAGASIALPVGAGQGRWKATIVGSTEYEISCMACHGLEVIVVVASKN